ncbi:DNA alkylation repair protein [Ruegeria sp. ANG-S4]|uniref:DNA alkylation repair protein n=1 Tax=Ruegeria sp. ANG-S4 TaxID=1577904 RepID=UPI00057F4398|nr:DNA alkylation repair protein [Ruegeria sp. ANG-S4]KIC47062.1 DNA alkylation repair protein [Ruegeria sp. ANG-S4]
MTRNIETEFFLDQIRAHADALRAEQAAAYHKNARTHLGVPNPILNDLTKAWRQDLDIDQRVFLARALWQTDIHEGRLAAAKLLTQARIRPDQAVWDLLQSWLPDFDAWAVADHACMAMQKRLVANPERLDQVESWTESAHMWTRRAALVATLPWTKQNHPKPDDLQRRDRILGWAADYVPDQTWFIQKAIAWWLRELSKHDPERVIAFLKRYGNDMKPFARKEAGKFLRDQLE